MPKKRSDIDNPIFNDNRSYDFSHEDFYIRSEFKIISNWIKKDSTVIDLGCGNGSLIKYLNDNKGIIAKGVEISQSGVDSCSKNGFNVKQGEIDKIETYKEYANNQFDFSVCNVTIQMVNYPEVLIKEMSRISRYQIISFPNFAYFENRLDLLLNGIMPRPMPHKYSWFNTGHIHQLSNRDFKNFCKQNGIRIIKQAHLGCFKKIANLIWPNFFSKESIFLCEKYDL